MKIVKLIAAATSAVAMALLIAPAAHADDGPTVRELLEKCGNGADFCEFRPTGEPDVHRGEYKLAGGATNCTPDKITRWVEWSASQHTTNSVGMEMSAEFGIGEAFKVGYKASFGQEWGWSSTKTDKVQAEVGPHRAISVHSAPLKETVRGTYELHFGDRFHGHYYWYVHNVEVTGPASDAWDTRVEPANADC